MNDFKGKTDDQLRGRLTYISKACEECNFDSCIGCNFERENEKIEEELTNRNRNGFERFIK